MCIIGKMKYRKWKNLKKNAKDILLIYINLPLIHF